MISRYLNKHKIAFLLLGLIFLLVACGPSGYQTGVGETAMRQIYNRVNNGSLDAWSIAAFWAPLWWAAFAFSLCLVGGLMMGGVSGASLRHHNSRSGTGWAIGCSGGAMFGFFMALVVFLLARSSILNAAPEKAEKQANHAIVEGIDQAKYDKANTFVEVLHTPVVDTTFERLECKKSVNTRSNCAPWEWTHEINHRTVCDSYDDDGRCTSSHTESDTEHVPYFTHMVRYLVIVNLYEKLATPETGLVSSGVENFPKMYLSEWLLPQDYDNHWYGYARPLFMQIEPVDYTPPADWQRYHSARLAGQVSLMNVYHRYPNWILITDNVYASGSTPDAYKAAGLLPGMNSLYSRIGTGVQADYDFVTFLNIETSQEMYYAWQDAAAEAFTFFANDRQASLAVIFAPEGQVENLGTIDDWANALKANYDQRNVWFITLQGERMQRMLPKNLFILACTVANAQIMECRLKSGMPTGNERLMEAFSNNGDPYMADRSFTPEAFFGQISATLVPSDGSYPVVQLHGVGQNIFGMTMREDPNGIRRISMTAFEYLKADVHLEVADINRLVAKEVGVQKHAAQAATLTAFLVFGGFLGTHVHFVRDVPKPTLINSIEVSKRMKLNKHILSFVLLLAFLLPVLACGRSSRPSVAETASQISTELKVAYLEANKLYEDLVRQESMLTADYRVWQESYSSMLAGAGDQVGTLDSCYEQSATVIAQAANAVFAADSEGNPLTAAQENQAFINALATGGTLYAGDITRCQEAGLQLMSYIRAERATLNNQRAKITDELRVYDVTQVGNLKIATVMHFYNQYGPQLAQVVENGEEAVLKALSAENGLDPLPIDFIGFPTAALKVQTNSARICDGYFAMYNGQTATVGNHNPKLFQAESDPVLGSCTLYRMAAYQYMNRLFLTVQASNRIDCGTDADIYSTVNEDCTVSP